MNTKVPEIEINHYQLKNILIKLDIFKRHHKYIKKADTWKIQLTIAINLLSSKDNDEERVMHSKSDNIEIMVIEEEDEVTKRRFA